MCETSFATTLFTCSASVSSNVLTATLTNTYTAVNTATSSTTPVASAQTLSAGTFTIYLYLDQDGTTLVVTNLQYGVKITYNNPLGTAGAVPPYQPFKTGVTTAAAILYDCDTTSSARATFSAAVSGNALTVPVATFSISLSKNVKDDWSFTFATGFSKTLYNTEYFQFGLGWL